MTKERLGKSLSDQVAAIDTADRLYVARLPADAVFVNVGRGDLVKSSEL
jgi:phosphoglycerate dehydrogenase-like enzyme